MKARVVALTLVASVLHSAIGAMPASAGAQQPEKTSVIAWFSPWARFPVADHMTTVFRDGLRERGWIEGKGFVIVRRDAAGDQTRLDAVAADVVKLNPDVIITVGLAGVAARRATAIIPIISRFAGRVGQPGTAH